MKNILAPLALAAAVTLAGCTTLSTEQKLAVVKTVATEAAYVGASYDLRANPQHQAAFVLTVESLRGLANAGNYDPAAFRAALAGLPALHGATGALIDAGATLYSVSIGFVDLSSAPYVKAALEGIIAGLDDALGSNAAGIVAKNRGPIAPPLPPQCIVPQR